MTTAAAVRPLGAKALRDRPGRPRRTETAGLQLYTIREALEWDLEGSLARVARIGYREVDLAGLHGKSAAEFRQALDRVGLTAPSSHVALERLQGNALAGTLDDARTPRPSIPDRRCTQGHGPAARAGDDRRREWRDGLAHHLRTRRPGGGRHWFVEHDEPQDAIASIRASYEYLAALEF